MGIDPITRRGRQRRGPSVDASHNVLNHVFLSQLAMNELERLANRLSRVSPPKRRLMPTSACGRAQQLLSVPLLSPGARQKA